MVEEAAEEEMPLAYPKAEGNTEEVNLVHRQVVEHPGEEMHLAYPKAEEDTEEVNLAHRQVGEHPGEEAKAGWCSLQEAYHLEGGYHQVEDPEEMRAEWCLLQEEHHMEECFHPVVCHSWDRFSDDPTVLKYRASAPELR
ncbi:hypothetical protein GB937_009387 [Aspergillus fischeri]|nr:hypothetical protein GB937_009387 [Aspergillus fischeri]